MLVVVRCPGCRGASRVAPEAVGLVVACPRCHEPFLAVEEATPVAPPPKPDAPRPAGRSAPAESRGWAEPVAPPREAARPRRRRRPGKADEPGPAGPTAPDPVDPHDPAHAGGLPASVLIGLALLPFAIPLLWLIAPVALGQPPALTLAAPAALAVAASVLSLAVIYTVDWSPATRVKGVLMLVGLAYFAGLSLYFLKKDMLDRVRNAFGPEREWKEYRPRGVYRVKMPGQPTPTGEALLPGWKLDALKASERRAFEGPFVYVAGMGPDRKPEPDEEEWFKEVRQALEQSAGAPANGPGERPGRAHDFPGRQWEFHLPDGVTVRHVQVFRDKDRGRVFYLSAEGPRLGADDAEFFFGSFHVIPPPAKGP